MQIKSALSHATPDMVNLLPYPHIIIENALSSELYEALSDRFPPMQLFAGKRTGSNRVMFHKAGPALTGSDLDPLWREFVRYHTSAVFYAEVLRVFGAHIREMYPDRRWKSMSTGVRAIDSCNEKTILMDAPIGINTPVVGPPSSVRGPHVDDPQKLYNGLLYFRHPDDDAKGGSFVIYDYENGRLAEHSQVPYVANSLVFFINSARSVHAVSQREAGGYPRRYVSFNGELTGPLFRENKIIK